MVQPSTIAEQLRTNMDGFTPSERKIARVLLANYPMVGLDTIAQFAARAHVSGPSILRWVARLGFDSYGAFQSKLRAELEVRLQSPLARHETPNTQIDDNDFLAHFAHKLHTLMQDTIAHIPRGEFDGAVELLCDTRRPVWLLGGRLTRPLAEVLANHLKAMRPDIELISSHPSNWPHAIADMHKGDTLVIFDIRRYWEDAAHLADIASQRKLNIILFTDEFHSPITRVARHILPAHLAHASSWDANTPLMMLIDALVFAMSRKNKNSAHKRLSEIEQLRAIFAEKTSTHGPQNTLESKTTFRA